MATLPSEKHTPQPQQAAGAPILLFDVIVIICMGLGVALAPLTVHARVLHGVSLMVGLVALAVRFLLRPDGQLRPLLAVVAGLSLGVGLSPVLVPSLRAAVGL